jgi:PST family polysaccharide transporter
MEKMKYIAVFNILAKLISYIPFFIFIRVSKDYILVPVFYSIGYVLAGMVSIYFIYFKEKMKWFIPTVKEIRFALSDSSTYFLSRLSLSFFTYSNTLLLKLICGNTAVGYYSAAEKIYQAYNWLLVPLSSVLYPHMANKKDVPFYKRILKIIVPANLVIVASVLLCSFWVIRILYGVQEQPETLNVFRILMTGCFWTIPSILMGYPFLAAMGHASYTNWTIVIVSIVHIAGLLLLFASGLLSIYTVAVMTILTELLLFAFRLRGVSKFKLLSACAR